MKITFTFTDENGEESTVAADEKNCSASYIDLELLSEEEKDEDNIEEPEKED